MASQLKEFAQGHPAVKRQGQNSELLSSVFPEVPAQHSCYPETMKSTWALEIDQSFIQVCHVTFNKLLHFSEPQFFNWKKQQQLPHSYKDYMKLG